MVYDEKRRCWWLMGECHRPRVREHVLVITSVVVLVIAGVRFLLGGS